MRDLVDERHGDRIISDIKRCLPASTATQTIIDAFLAYGEKVREAAAELCSNADTSTRPCDLGDTVRAMPLPAPAHADVLADLHGRGEALRASTEADVIDHAMDRAKGALAQVMAEVEAMRDRKRKAYLERSRCVALVARMAIAMGFRAGVRNTAIERWSDDWHGCVYVDLPTGQVSWHYRDDHGFLFADLPPYPEHVPWDGHDTIEKYARVAKAFGPACAGFGGRVAIYDAGDFTTIADCGNGRWAVRRQGECLGRSGSWEDEPPPSRRDDAFLERCRFEDPAHAWQVLNTARASVGGTWEDAAREMTGGARCGTGR